MEMQLIYDASEKLPAFMDKQDFKKYVYKFVNNPDQRRIYLKIPKGEITTTAKEYELNLKVPAPIKAVELTGRSAGFVFFTLHF